MEITEPGVYCLEEDFVGDIFILSSNVNLDGKWKTLFGCIRLENVNNISISNLNIKLEEEKEAFVFVKNCHGCNLTDIHLESETLKIDPLMDFKRTTGKVLFGNETEFKEIPCGHTCVYVNENSFTKIE